MSMRTAAATACAFARGAIAVVDALTSEAIHGPACRALEVDERGRHRDP